LKVRGREGLGPPPASDCRTTGEMPRDGARAEDIQTVRQVLAGDVDAFEGLITSYGGYIAAVVARHLPGEHVEETVHEVFVRAYQSLPGFSQSGSFKYWLSRIAVRACYDFWRRRYRSKEVPMSSLSPEHGNWVERVLAEDSEEAHEREEARKEAGEILEWALARLSPEDRMVLGLVHLEGRSTRETADLLGWTVANVKIRSFRSRRALRKMIEGIPGAGKEG